MSEGLVKKKRIRAGHRGVVTKRVEAAKALLRTDDPDPVQVTRFVTILEEKLIVLKRLDGEILELLVDEEAIVAEIEAADEYNQSIHDFLLTMQKVITQLSTRVSKPSTGTTKEELGVLSNRQARLPKLALPSFDGTLTNWVSFWELYEVAVHSNPELSDVQKFSYLKSLVEGSAKEAIDGLSLSKESYLEAVDILTKRFGNKQKIIDRHMSLLLNTERVSSANNIAALRRLSDNIEANMRALRALGVKPESYGSLLSSVLVQRLPQELRLIAGRQIRGDWTLPDIMKVVNQELEARERTATPLESGPHLEGSVKKNLKTEKASVATLVSGQVSNNRDSSAPFCCYCQKNHLSEECNTVTRMDDRRKILRTSGRCFLCLRRGHIARECRSRNRCRVCKNRHHCSICQTDTTLDKANISTPASKNENSARTTTHLLTSVRTNTQLDPKAPPFQSLTVSVGKETKILLQTATVSMFNPRCPGSEMDGTVIFDSGSQRSYISQTVVDHLHLKRCGSQVLSIITFGKKAGHQLRCDVVKVGLKKKEQSIQELTLLSVPSICGALKGIPRSELETKYPQLTELDLADQMDVDGTVPVLLIGMDYYWNFITGETLQCADGPVATRTSLGWVISGPVVTRARESTSTNLVT